MLFYAYLGVLWTLLIAVHILIVYYGIFDTIAYATGFAVIIATNILYNYFPNLKKSLLVPAGSCLLLAFLVYCGINAAVYGAGCFAAGMLFVMYLNFWARKQPPTETDSLE